jgi:hypothetical protein
LHLHIVEIQCIGCSFPFMVPTLISSYESTRQVYCVLVYRKRKRPSERWGRVRKTVSTYQVAILFQEWLYVSWISVTELARWVGVGVRLAADSQSTSKSGYRASFWDPWKILSCSFFVWQLRRSAFNASSLTRKQVCNLLLNCFWALPEQSHSSRSPTELTAISYCLFWDSPNLEGQVPVFISPRNGVAQVYPRALGSLSVASYDSQGLRWEYSNPPPHGVSSLRFM